MEALQRGGSAGAAEDRELDAALGEAAGLGVEMVWLVLVRITCYASSRMIRSRQAPNSCWRRDLAVWATQQPRSVKSTAGRPLLAGVLVAADEAVGDGLAAPRARRGPRREYFAPRSFLTDVARELPADVHVTELAVLVSALTALPSTIVRASS